jgi:hypothetical protein
MPPQLTLNDRSLDSQTIGSCEEAAGPPEFVRPEADPEIDAGASEEWYRYSACRFLVPGSVIGPRTSVLELVPPHGRELILVAIEARQVSAERG